MTAPHATPPFREEQARFSDGGGTGGLAAGLNAICDVTAISTTFDSPSDPNFYDDNAFKTSLAELIASVKPALLLDIHAIHIGPTNRGLSACKCDKPVGEDESVAGQGA